MFNKIDKIFTSSFKSLYMFLNSINGKLKQGVEERPPIPKRSQYYDHANTWPKLTNMISSVITICSI